MGLEGVPRALVERSKASLLKARGGHSHDEMLAHEFDVQSWSLQEPHAREGLAALKAKISGGKK